MDRRILVPQSDYFRPSARSSPGLRVDGASALLFVSGQVPRDAQGENVGRGDIVAQFHQTMRNVGAVLAAGGAGFEHVARLTMYLTDLSAVRQLLDARAEYFSGQVPPSTTVQVAALPHPDWMIEIEAIAVL